MQLTLRHHLPSTKPSNRLVTETIVTSIHRMCSLFNPTATPSLPFQKPSKTQAFRLSPFPLLHPICSCFYICWWQWSWCTRKCTRSRWRNFEKQATQVANHVIVFTQGLEQSLCCSNNKPRGRNAYRLDARLRQWKCESESVARHLWSNTTSKPALSSRKILQVGSPLSSLSFPPLCSASFS